jgi:TonB family protein
MLTNTDRYVNRLGIGFVIALCVHAALFVLLQFVLQIRLFEKPEYPQSIYISLESTSARTVETRTNVTDTTRNVVDTKIETKVTDTVKKSSASTNTQAKSNTNTQASKSGTVTEQKKSATTTNTSIVKKTTDTTVKNTNSGNTVNDSVPVKGEDVSGSTTGKSALDDLSSLDSAISRGSDSGTSGTSSTGGTGATTGKQGSTKTGGSVGGTIEWEGSDTRATRVVVQPKIPTWVQKQGLRLQTTLSFVLTSEGLLLNVLVVKTSGYTDVDNAFRDALRGYRFDPLEGARNIKGTITFVIDYR